MEITWSNFWYSPVAVGTLVAAISGIGIAVGLEVYQAWRRNQERFAQARIIFSVLCPPLGQISAAAERALGDPRINEPQEFVVALQRQDRVFALPVPEVMLQVFDRLHFLPKAVAAELALLYSDLIGWRSVYETMANAVGVRAEVAAAMPIIYRRVNERVTKVVRAARMAKLPVEGLEDIA